jgi:hypothetical protein
MKQTTDNTAMAGLPAAPAASAAAAAKEQEAEARQELAKEQQNRNSRRYTEITNAPSGSALGMEAISRTYTACFTYLFFVTGACDLPVS